MPAAQNRVHCEHHQASHNLDDINDARQITGVRMIIDILRENAAKARLPRFLDCAVQFVSVSGNSSVDHGDAMLGGVLGNRDPCGVVVHSGDEKIVAREVMTPLGCLLKAVRIPLNRAREASFLR